MYQSFDIAILGAGPAGAAAAITAARAGLSTALIDKALFPRDKLCGGLVSGRAWKTLKLFPGIEAEPDLFLKCDHIEFHWQGTRLTDFRATTPLRFTTRITFDHALVRAAAASGATLLCGQKVAGLDSHGNRLLFENGDTLSYRILIGADGVNSWLARRLFGRAFDPGTIGFALEVEMQPRPEPTVVVDFGAAHWGYGWKFPKSDSTTIGVGGLHSKNPDLKTALAGLLSEDPATKLKGQYIPFGDFRRQPGRYNILLAGDAAGLVDPVTGEGIALALESGRHAAESAAWALASGIPSSACSRYQRALAPIHHELTRALRLRRMIFSDAYRAAFRARLASSQTLPALFLDLLNGDITYRELQWRAAKRLIFKADM